MPFFPRPHRHRWTLARVEWENTGPLGWLTRVGYLLCPQCGALKLVVPE